MASTFDSGMKPGVEIVRKVVVHLDNLSNDITEDMIQKHLESLGVSIISCFPSKSWMLDDEKDLVTAMHLCVPLESKEKILDSAAWPRGVIVREWKFKAIQIVKVDHGTD